MKLYEITEVYQNIMNLIEEGVIPEQEIGTHLENIEDSLKDKFENITKLIRSLERENEAFKAEAERMKEKEKRNKNRIDNLKNYMENTMKLIGEDKIKTDLFTVYIQNNPPKLKVYSEKNIPKEYFKIEEKLKRRELLEAIKDGKKFDGVDVEQGRSLRIR